MPFNYLLTNLLVDVQSAVGAIFVDDEGEAIDWVTRHNDPYDLKVEGAYHSIFKRHLERLAEAISAGPIDGYVIASDRLVSLTAALPDGYYLVLVSDRYGSQAQAMYFLKRTAEVIAREIA